MRPTSEQDFRLGLRARLILLIIGMLIPLSSFDLFALYQQREQRITLAAQQVHDAAEAVVERYRDAIDDARSTLDLLSRVPEVIGGDPTTCRIFLENAKRARPWVASFFLVDPDGNIHCATAEKAVGLNVSQRAWYLKTVQATEFTVSDFYLTLATKQPVVSAALPFAPMTGNEHPQVIMATLDLAWFESLATKLGEKYDASVLLLDGSAVGLAHYPRLPGIIGKDLSDKAVVRTVLAEQNSFFEGPDFQGDNRFFSFARLPGTDARVVVGVDRKTVLAPINALLLRGAIVFLGVAALLGCVIWLYGRRIFVGPLLSAAQSLRKNEAFLRGVVEGSGDSIKVIDCAGNITFISRNGLRLLEITEPEAILGRPLLSLLPNAIHPEVSAKLLEANAGKSVRFDAEIFTIKGRPLYIDVLITPLRDAEGKVESLVAIARDITHMKLTEQAARDAECAARDSEARYRLLAENSTDMITHMDLAGRRLFVSPGSRDLLGFEPDELVGTSPQQTLHPDDSIGLAAVLDKLKSGHETRALNVNRLRHRDGTWIWVEASLRLLKDEEAKPVGFVASVRSIMDRKRDNQAMRESEARYRLLADHCSDLILLGGFGEAPSYVSPAVTPLLGYTVEEAQSVEMGELTHPEDAALVKSVKQGIGPDHPSGAATYRLRHKSGRYVWVEAAFHYVDRSDGAIRIVESVRDISERHRQAEELHLAKEVADVARSHADFANRAKTDFLASMSHEIRTPLNAIIGFTGLIIDKGDDLAPDVRRHAELVRLSGAALLTVVDDILDFSKIEAGAVALDERPFILRPLIENCVSIVRGALGNKPLDVRVSFDPGLPKTVVGDESRLRQILFNLLNNAVKFTREGYVSLSVRHQGSSPGREQIHFSITDTGIGIAKDRQARLFQRFSQADASIKREFGGTGLGLAICRRLVELMDGEIGVFSDEGRGATFWFTVTMQSGRPNLELVPTSTTAVEAVPYKKGRLLLVEDVGLNQELARIILERVGHSVDVVGDGAAAVSAVQTRDYDLVLMDVQMPGMDGLAATQIIRGMERGGHPHLPIVAMTANVLPDQIREFHKAGMDDHVGKPFKPKELYLVINRWLPDSDMDQK